MKFQAKNCVQVVVVIGLLIVFSAAGLAQNWVTGPSLSYARHGPDAVEHNGDVYVIGGWNGGDKLEVLYAGMTTWTELASLPVKQEGLCAAVVNDKIYTMGSYGPADTCQIYDIGTDTWSAGPNLPEALYWATAEAVGTNVYLIAGYTPGGAGSRDTLYVLDTTTLKWSQAASMPGPIQIPASAVWGGYIYAFGNYGAYYKYEIATDSWTTFTGPPSGHGYASEAVTVKDNIYLIGGNSGYIYEAYQNTEIFDPLTEAWTTGPDLNVGRYQFGAVYVANDNTIYACAGRDANAQSISSVEMLSFQGFTLSVSPQPLVPGQNGTFTVTNGDANTYTYLGYSLVGTGSIYVPWLNVTLGIASPKKAAGPTQTNSQGGLTWTIRIPTAGSGRKVWLQAVQYGNVSNVVATSIQ